MAVTREALTFLSWYNGISRRVQARAYQRTGKAAAAESQRYLAWCEDNAVDPRRWCLAKHDALKWQARIPIKHLTRSTPKFMEAFREWGDDRRAAADLQHRLQVKTIDETQRPTGMTHFGEAVKRALQLETGICAIHRFTSHHTDSMWCQSCPVAPC